MTKKNLQLIIDGRAGEGSYEERIPNRSRISRADFGETMPRYEFMADACLHWRARLKKKKKRRRGRKRSWTESYGTFSCDLGELQFSRLNSISTRSSICRSSKNRSLASCRDGAGANLDLKTVKARRTIISILRSL